MDDYSDAPVSIGEARSDKEGDAALWSTRDMLIAMLRDIDNGKVAPVHTIIAFRETNADGNFIRYWVAGGGDNGKNRTGPMIGLLEQVKAIILDKWMGQ